MVQIVAVEGWHNIGDLVVFGSQAYGDMPLLALQRGDDMVYDQQDGFVVDYPGEYEKDHLTIFAVETHEGRMHYIVQTDDNKRIGIVQHAKALSHDVMTDCDFWVVTEEKIGEKLTKMEYEGKQIILN